MRDFRRVDAHERQPLLLEQPKCPLTVAFGLEPRRRAKLDADPVVRKPLAQGSHLLAALASRHEPARVLEKDPAQPPSLVQRAQRLLEPPPRLLERFGIEVARVDIALLRGVLGQALS